jgi:hypothetical protein
MWDIPVPGYQSFWTNKRSTLKSEHQTLVQQYSDADAQQNQLFEVLGGIEDVAGHNPASAGESVERAIIVNAAEENGANYCKALHGKTLLVPCMACTVTLQELMAVLKTRTLADQINSPKVTGKQTTQEDGFREVRRQVASH